MRPSRQRHRDAVCGEHKSHHRAAVGQGVPLKGSRVHSFIPSLVISFSLPARRHLLSGCYESGIDQERSQLDSVSAQSAFTRVLCTVGGGVPGGSHPHQTSSRLRRSVR